MFTLLRFFYRIYIKITDGGMGMPRRITDACIACGACAAECPVDDCIAEGDIYVIDEEICIDCGLCQTVCPTDAIIEV